MTECGGDVKKDACVAYHQWHALIEGNKTRKPLGVRFLPVWKNSGKTQGKDASSWVNQYWSEKPLRPDFNFPDYDAKGNVVKSGGLITFYPPESSQPAIPLFARMAEIDSVNKKKIHYYLYGWVRYRDVFEGTQPHVTMSCYELLGVGTIPERLPAGNSSGQSTTIATQLCDNIYHRNCTDDQCKK